MRSVKPRASGRIGLIDYVAMAVGSSLAAYSTGMAVSQPKVGQFFAMGICGGTVIAFILRTLLSRFSIVKADGVLYAAATVAGLLLAPGMNASLPDGGFPREVLTGGFLCWMLLMGSMFTWRDGTLLFQAIPSIALFGLVGCYDTFKSVPFFFFGFMLCLATVFARAHAREMLRQSVESGFFARHTAPGTQIEVPEDSPELYQAVREGPWKWVAGPEWALASALTVIAVSLVGAPVIRLTVAPLSGFVSIPTPQVRSTGTLGGNPASSNAPGTSRVGLGPNTMLSKESIYAVKMDRARYLRTATYGVYSGNGWITLTPKIYDARDPALMGPSELTIAVDSIKRGSEFSFEVKPLVNTKVIPLPAETFKLANPESVRLYVDGTAEVFGPAVTDAIKGRAVEFRGDRSTANVPSDWPRMPGWQIPARITQFAKIATRHAKTDYERAEKIRAAIAEQCRYNLRAAAVPAGQDPAEYFLFESQEGYCDLFATAMARSAQAIGLPARYVVGYLPEPSAKDTSGHYIVKGTDYHAWCEIFLKDVGWTIFDATEGAAEVPDGGRGDDPNSTPFWSQPWFDSVLNGLIAVAACVGVGSYVINRRSRRASKGDRADAAKVYRSFQRILEKRGKTIRLPQETPEEFLLRVRVALGEQSEAARVLNARYVQALYGPQLPTEADLADLRAATRAFRQALSRQAK